MQHRARRLGLGLAVALMGGFLGFGQNSMAGELPGDFQPRAAINHPSNERTVTEWSATRVIDGTDADGVELFVQPGERYEITAAGHISYWADAPKPWLSDPECSVEATGHHSAEPHRWVPDRWNAKYGHDYLDLVMADALGSAGRYSELAWSPVRPFTNGANGSPQCSTIHTYTSSFVAPSTNVRLVVDDRQGQSDNAGHITVTVSGPPPRFEQDYQCPKWTEEQPGIQPGRTLGELDVALMRVDSRRNANEHPDPSAAGPGGERPVDYWQETGHFGMYTCNWVVPDGTYLLEVKGTYTYGPEGHVADAECSRTPSDPQFRNDRFMDRDNIEERDWLDLYPAFQQMDWIPMGRIDPDDPDCSLDHLYCIKFVPSFAGPLNFKIYDLFYAEEDNTGGLDISLQKIA